MKRFLSILLAAMIPLHAAAAASAAEFPEISAPSAVLLEVSSGKILFEKNAREVRPCGALSSLMTLLLSFEAIDRGALELSQQLPASAAAAAAGGVGVWIREGEALSCDELIRAVAVVSAGDAEAVLAEKLAGSIEVFSELAKQRARELSDVPDSFVPDVSGESKASARALAQIGRELCLNGRIFDYSRSRIDSIRGGETQLVSANSLLKTYSGANGLKTASTQAAGACIAASAEREGMTLLCVVLGAGNSQERFSDAEALLDFGFEHYSLVTPVLPALPKLPVSGAMEREVSLTAEKPQPVLCEKGKEKELSVSLILPEAAAAPVLRGEKAGTAEIRIGAEPVQTLELFYETGADAISFSRVLRLLFDIFITF